jgi:hypothetical protein
VVEGGLNFQHYGMLGIDDRFTFYGIAAQGNRNYNLPTTFPSIRGADAPA